MENKKHYLYKNYTVVFIKGADGIWRLDNVDRMNENDLKNYGLLKLYIEVELSDLNALEVA